MQSTRSTTGFEYKELADSLTRRIDSHKNYSNFDLHDWVSQRFNIATGSSVLDLGCGSGNLTDFFSRSVGSEGSVVGIDKDPELIVQASARHPQGDGKPVRFSVADFDQPLPRPGTPFDWIFAVYSLYYTNRADELMQDLAGMLKRGGHLVIIGPGPENGIDQEAINLQVTGRNPKPEYLQRQERLANEFFPLARQIFSRRAIERQIVDSTMTFPSRAAFCDYYFSTLLWRDSIEGRTPDDVRGLQEFARTNAVLSEPIVVRKQMYCIVAEA